MTLRACLLVGATVLLAACGPNQSGSHGPGGTDMAAGGVGGSGGMSGGGGTGGPASLTITPNPVALTVEVDNGVAVPQTVAFVAHDENGAAASANWQISRGELGSLDVQTGQFVPSGKNVGAATVTATATIGGASATASLSITVHAVNKGATPQSGTGPQTGAAPSGGFNGVGGQPLSPTPPPDPVVTVLQTKTGNDNGYQLLYPYDGTVFPRAILPPLLQWSVPSGFHVSAISVHLKEQGYDFSGYYSGADLTNAPVDAAAWATATAGNQGDPLTVELKVTDGTQVLGPLVQHWTIAKSPLRGTVYYNTYDSRLNSGAPPPGTQINGSNGIGSVLRIDPGAISPTLAVPALDGKCHVCHEVSADGSTLFTANTIDDTLTSGEIYDLRQSPPKQIATYSKKNTPASGGMFTYGGAYPDGSMMLASSQEDYHAWSGNSDLFSTLTQTSVGTSGFSNLVTRAVTPSYSPDGRKVAFAFWGGSGTSTTKPGYGNLAVMDFSCGAPMSSVTCAAGGPYAFANLRQLYSDTDGSHCVGWPSFTPDSRMVVFQHTYVKSSDGGVNSGSWLNTRGGAHAEIWLADVPDATGTVVRFAPERLCALNGYASSDCTTPTLPSNSAIQHTIDWQMNYEPNVTPIASGGYYWVVFTSRRLYGNQTKTDPYFPMQDDKTEVTDPPAKKLWMAAIDPNPKPGVDPSHPAFYLPGQELLAGNMKAYWVNEPCHSSTAPPPGNQCQTGDECCSGYCTDKLVCGDKPVGCTPEFGKCTQDSDCCGGGSLVCIDNLCSVRPIT